LGSGATLQYFLAEILDEVSAKIDLGLYFGLRPGSKEPKGGFPKTFFSVEHGQKFPVGYDSAGVISTLEAVMSSFHGSVEGYVENEENVVVPVFAEGIGQELEDWGLRVVRQVVMDAVDALPTDTIPLDITADTRPVIASNHDTFWKTPTKDEAEAWGQYPMEDGWAGDGFIVQFTRKITLKDCAKAFLNNQIWFGRHVWVEGSLMRESHLKRTLLQSLMKLRKLFSRISNKLGIN